MTCFVAEDIQYLESALAIALPETYKAFLLEQAPLHDIVGQFGDSLEWLIERNISCRTHDFSANCGRRISLSSIAMAAAICIFLIWHVLLRRFFLLIMKCQHPKTALWRKNKRQHSLPGSCSSSRRRQITTLRNKYIARESSERDGGSFGRSPKLG